jgi:hypothetical protein
MLERTHEMHSAAGIVPERGDRLQRDDRTDGQR